MIADPESPENVRLRYVDGSTSDVLPLLYRGLDDDGCHLWETFAPLDDRTPLALLVGVMPGRTTIRVAVP